MNYSFLVSGVTTMQATNHAGQNAALRVEPASFQKTYGSICRRIILRLLKHRSD